MAEEEVARDAQRDAHNNRILLELVEQVRGLHHLHVYEPKHRSRYVDGSVNVGLDPFPFTDLGKSKEYRRTMTSLSLILLLYCIITTLFALIM